MIHTAGFVFIDASYALCGSSTFYISRSRRAKNARIRRFAANHTRIVFLSHISQWFCGEPHSRVDDEGEVRNLERKSHTDQRAALGLGFMMRVLSIASSA
jgi:hypothetical protein